MKGETDPGRNPVSPDLHEWENLHESAASATRRMRVPGGWLYQTATCPPGESTVAVGLAFVPDPAPAPAPVALRRHHSVGSPLAGAMDATP